MEPRLGRMFHSSAAGRRREQLFLTRSVLVKRSAHEMTLRKCRAARRRQPRCPPNLDRQSSPDARPIGNQTATRPDVAAAHADAEEMDRVYAMNLAMIRKAAQG
jgi:hypothetical protein